VRDQRQRVDEDNPFRRLERTAASMVTQWWDGARDIQDFWIETTFHWLYGAPHIKEMGERLSRRISEAPQEDLRSLVHVQDALDRMDDGGFAEGVVRMLIFLAQSRGQVRRSRLQRSNEILEQTEPYASMKPKHRTRLIHRESLIVAFEPEAALEGLAKLLKTPEERQRAIDVCWQIAGPEDEMSQATVDMMHRFGEILDVPPESLPQPPSGVNGGGDGNGQKRPRTGTTG
jgi:tellurite resistance protein